MTELKNYLLQALGEMHTHLGLSVFRLISPGRLPLH
jgi:hypothetical protein